MHGLENYVGVKEVVDERINEIVLRWCSHIKKRIL